MNNGSILSVLKSKFDLGVILFIIILGLFLWSIYLKYKRNECSNDKNKPDGWCTLGDILFYGIIIVPLLLVLFRMIFS